MNIHTGTLINTITVTRITMVMVMGMVMILVKERNLYFQDLNLKVLKPLFKEAFFIPFFLDEKGFYFVIHTFFPIKK